MEKKPSFAELLSNAIFSNDRSQSWLAAKVGVSTTTVGRWCNGESRPASEKIEQIALQLNLDKSQLLEAAGYVYHTQPIQTAEIGVSSAILGGVPSRPTLLVGREGDLAALQQRLMGDDSTTLLTAVRGWPGVGKTTIAAALAHDANLQQSFPDGVLWTALGEEPSLLLTLGSEWMMALGDDPQRYPTVKGHSARLRSMLQAD
jgi:transcriptional regulator with XRE-family HTH domain